MQLITEATGPAIEKAIDALMFPRAPRECFRARAGIMKLSGSNNASKSIYGLSVQPQVYLARFRIL